LIVSVLMQHDVWLFQKCNLGHPVSFLSLGVDPPAVASIERAVHILREVGAVTTPPGAPAPTLTPLGHHLAALPVNVRIGKMLVYAAVLGSLQPMVRDCICGGVISAVISSKWYDCL
jgi:HrpA-like RNA helicase